MDCSRTISLSSNMMPRLRNSGPLEREGRDSESESDDGISDADYRIDASENQFTKGMSGPSCTSPHSSASSDSSIGSFIGSRDRSSPFHPTLIDNRQLYTGFPFIFATDAYHCTETVHGNQNGDCVRYLKPMNRGQRTPYFFTGFDWKDVDGQQCSVSLLYGILGNNSAHRQRCPVLNFVMPGKSRSIDCCTMLVSWRRYRPS
jgi:hypothetical protein